MSPGERRKEANFKQPAVARRTESFYQLSPISRQLLLKRLFSMATGLVILFAAASRGNAQCSVGSNAYLHVVYQWSGGSYLGNATTFLGTTAWGAVFFPAVSGTLYFGNNNPGNGTASIDILVGAALAAGKWSGSTTIQSAADWSPQYTQGNGMTLTVCLVDPAQSPSTLHTETKTITGMSNYVAKPTTVVGTVTYKANECTFTFACGPSPVNCTDLQPPASCP